jgi:AraC-like DNA-binding protein
MTEVVRMRNSEVSDVSVSIHQRTLDKIVALAVKFISSEGTSRTSIPFLSLMTSSRPTPLAYGVLTPSFCMLIQGKKTFHRGNDVVRYVAGDYLASVIDMPGAGQVIEASKSSPYIGIRVELTAKEIMDVVLDAQITITSGDRLKPAAFVGKADSELLDLIIKMLRLLEKQKDAAFLAGHLRREMIYRLLTGECGHLFYQNAVIEQRVAGIGKAIAWVKENFSEPLDVEKLAKSSNMSVSTLHHKFKAVTAMAPLQYQKKLRLQEARRLLMSGSVDATTAALEVGYESPSQFNREYRRLFGLPPLQDIKAMRKKSIVSEP